MTDTLQYLGFLGPEEKDSLLVSDVAVERFLQRSGIETRDRREIVQKIKELVRTCPAVDGPGDDTFVRVTGQLPEPVWIVVSGRIVRTVLSHAQFLEREGRDHGKRDPQGSD